MRKETPRCANIKDVARLAGVSCMTVSRVFNAPEKVSGKTLRLVQEAIKKTGYVPNRIASGFGRMSTGQVAVMVPSLSNLVFLDFLDGLASILEPKHMQMTISDYHYRQAQLGERILNALAWSPDALVIAGQIPDNAREALQGHRIPVVETFELVDEVFDCNVGISHEKAGWDMAAYLIGMGYRNIITVSANEGLVSRTHQRIKGVRSCFANAGLPEPESITIAERSSIKLGADIMSGILERKTGSDAIFFANDDMAYGAVMMCRQKGVNVPDDIGIAGFNGLDLALQCCPAITTVIVDRKRIGSESARLILARLEAPLEKEIIDIGYEIYHGQSTKCADP